MKRMLISKNLFILIFMDIFLVSLSYFLAYITRFEAAITPYEMSNIRHTIIPIICCKIFVFYFFSLYRGMWRYTSVVDLVNVIKAVSVSSLLIIATIVMLKSFHGYSRSVFIIDALYTFIFIGGVRVLIRLVLANNNGARFRSNAKNDNIRKDIVIIGAGDAGEKVIREIHENPRMRYNVIGIFDDNKLKHGKYIHGVEVVGNIESLQGWEEISSVDEILIAAPSAVGSKMRRIVDICESIGLPYKTLPGLGELIDGKVSIRTVREISYKDLLGRNPVNLSNEEISNVLKNKIVLVTGGGGSIGSELCRQICKYSPERILIVDANEANLYSIQMELQHSIPHLKFVAILAHVQNIKLMSDIFKKYRPHVVFHAAAYKHVPLIECNPWESIYSNIKGTRVISELSCANEVERFVLVSTDKAVRPTSVMGASKRIAERIIQSYANEKTKFMAVRFGNVIGSSGSVIPLFRQQIAKGGPVTVTHPDIERYFMTIEEAAQLILQACTMGKCGEIYILEMGIPVKIVDMARDLIRLSGKEPDVDIEIVYTGLRPGEKLFEELITEGEGIVRTEHKKIHVLSSNRQCETDSFRSEGKDFLSLVDLMIENSKKHSADIIKKDIQKLVPEYTFSNEKAIL